MFKLKLPSERRGFLGGFGAAAAAAALGFSRVVASAQAAEPAPANGATDYQRWLDSIKGKHNQVYDAPEPNNGMPLVYSWAYLATAPASYGVPESDIAVVVVLRHNAIPIAMSDSIWEKYRLGEVFKINDAATKMPATRNPFANTKPGDLPLPDAAFEKLVARNVKFGVCNLATTFYSGMVAQKMGMKPDEVKKEWVAGLLPGATLVPSGVVAVNGAQARGCSYCFAA